ncbi:MAG: hypothetical protein WBG86_06245 [Polyangiales bacterium]
MSASFDYSGLKTTADSLIARFGIPITLVRQSRSDGLDPWEQDQGPAATSAAQSVTANGVQVSLDKLTLELQTIERPLGRWVVDASTAIPEPLDTLWKLAANGLTYDVTAINPVQPGDTLMLYFVTVAL